MSVYIDDAMIPFGRMLMCHMIADSTNELLAMADKIGVQRKWIQLPGTPREHFDVCKQKRELAIKEGAIPISYRDDMPRFVQQRREATRAATEAS